MKMLPPEKNDRSGVGDHPKGQKTGGGGGGENGAKSGATARHMKVGRQSEERQKTKTRERLTRRRKGKGRM